MPEFSTPAPNPPVGYTSENPTKANGGVLVLDEVRNFSVVAQYGQRVQLAEGGTDFTTFDMSGITGSFVAQGGLKPVQNGTSDSLHMAKRKWAVIIPFTNEAVRENKNGVVTEARRAAAGALARAIDSLAITGSGIDGQSYIDQTDKAPITLGTTDVAEGGVFADFNEALRVLLNDRKKLTGFMLDDIVEPVLNGAVDRNGRPIWIESPLTIDENAVTRQGRLLGRPAYQVPDLEHDGIVGYAGDFRSIRWGTLSALTEDVNTTATVQLDSGEQVSAYQQNLTLFRYEAEVGVLVPDPNAFVPFQLSNES